MTADRSCVIEEHFRLSSYRIDVIFHALDFTICLYGPKKTQCGIWFRLMGHRDDCFAMQLEFPMAGSEILDGGVTEAFLRVSHMLIQISHRALNLNNVILEASDTSSGCFHPMKTGVVMMSIQ